MYLTKNNWKVADIRQERIPGRKKKLKAAIYEKKLGLLGLKKLTAAIYPTKSALDQEQLEGRSFSTRTRPWPKKKCFTTLSFQSPHLVHTTICSRPLFTKSNWLSIFVANKLMNILLYIVSIFLLMEQAVPSPSDG